MGEDRWRLPWPPPTPHPVLAEGHGLRVGQGAEEALGKGCSGDALLHLLSGTSGPHFQGDLWLLFLKKDLTVEHPLPSGLWLSYGPAGEYGEYRVLRSWAVGAARHQHGCWENALFPGLLPPESAPGSGRKLGCDFQGRLGESAFQEGAPLSGHLLAVSPSASGMELGVPAPQRQSSC